MTHDLSSGGLEAEIAKGVFSRSLEKYNFRHTKFVGAGDANSFKKVFDANVYGNNHPGQSLQVLVLFVLMLMSVLVMSMTVLLAMFQLSTGSSDGGDDTASVYATVGGGN